MKPCHRYLNALHPISLPLFVGLPKPTNLFLMYDLPTLQNISRCSLRAWPLKLGGVEDSWGKCEYGSGILLKSFKCIICTIRKVIIISL